MTRSHIPIVVCLSVLALGLFAFRAPVRSEEAPQGDMALGAASLKKTTERVTAMLQELQERCAKQARDVALPELVGFGPRVFGDYMALRVPVEVMAVQSALLAADRISTETVMVDGPGMLRERAGQAFGIAPDALEKLHGEKVAWSDVVLALAIAKATEKKPEDLLAQMKDGKAWPDVAVAAGLQGGKLPELIAPLFRE